MRGKGGPGEAQFFIFAKTHCNTYLRPWEELSTDTERRIHANELYATHSTAAVICAVTSSTSSSAPPPGLRIIHPPVHASLPSLLRCSSHFTPPQVLLSGRALQPVHEGVEAVEHERGRECAPGWQPVMF